MAKKQANFLDLVPKKISSVQWIVLDNGCIQIQIPRMSWLDKAVRLFARTPEVMKIDLDEYGSFIWKSIDGTKTTHELCEELKNAFGADIEPLYERFGAYVNILKNNNFIKI